MATANNTAPSHGLTINKGLPRQLFNRLLVSLLRSRFHALGGFDKIAMVLQYTGRKSGKSYTLPLAYVRARDTVTTVALFTNTVWWKNLRNNAPVVVRLQGREYHGVANVVEDPHAVAQGLLAIAASAPQQARAGYYRIPRAPKGQVDLDALLDLARTRVMITIDLHTSIVPIIEVFDIMQV